MFGLNNKFKYFLTMAILITLIIFTIASFSIGLSCTNTHLVGGKECKNEESKSSRNFLWVMFVPVALSMIGYTGHYGWSNKEVLDS
jgi:Na+/H+ antiporter NhaC